VPQDAEDNGILEESGVAVALGADGSGSGFAGVREGTPVAIQNGSGNRVKLEKTRFRPVVVLGRPSFSTVKVSDRLAKPLGNQGIGSHA